MTNFANQFKAEISRIARKESKQDIASLKSSNVQLKREVSQLKKQARALEKSLQALTKLVSGISSSRSLSAKSSFESGAAERAADGQEAAAVLRFRQDGFVRLRKKLDLSQAQMGRLIGVTSQAVYSWERGLSRPRPQQLQAIAKIRKLSRKSAALMLESLDQN